MGTTVLGRGRRLLAVIAALATVAAIPTATIAFGAATAAPAAAAAQPSGSIAKTGRDTATDSTDSVGGGDPVQWVVSARNTSGALADVQITDPVGAGQEYTPGSFKAPPGYTPQWSTDGGATWVGTDPGASTDHVRASASGVPDQGTGTSGAIPAPPASFGVGEVGGDGWEALFYGLDVYNVHHHRGAGGGTTMLDCHVKSTGQSCPGFPPGGLTVPATPGAPVGTGSDDYMTPESFRSVISPSGRMYTPVHLVRSTSIGFACIDLSAEPPVSCGFLQVSDAAPRSAPVGNGFAFSGLGGGIVAGSKLYAMTWDGRLACVDAAAQALCPATAGSGIVGAIDPGVAGRSAGTLQPSHDAQFVTVGTMAAGIAITNDGSGFHVDMLCYDLAANTRCRGYPRIAAQAVRAGGALPVLDTAGHLTGVCTQNRDGDNAVYCNAIPGGAALADPYPQRPAGTTTFGAFGLGDPAVAGTKVYVPYTDSVQVNDYTCFDFGTGQPCAGFTTVHTGSPARPYTLRLDPYLRNCVWELGDGGIYEIFDADSGRAGCANTGGEVTASPEAFYCDGSAGHVQGWDALTLSGLPAGQYSSATVTVRDADGHVLPGYDGVPLPANQRLDLSGIPVAGAATQLTAQVSLFGADRGAWQANPPALALTYRGDAPQVCLMTVAPVVCNAAPAQIANTATLAVTVAGATTQVTGSAALDYDYPTEACPRRLSFAKVADVATAVPGGTVGYTITATNTGRADFTAADPASFTDSLADVLDDATYNADATASAGTVSYAAPVLTWTGPLAVGRTVTVHYTVRVTRPDSGDHLLRNTVVGPADIDNNCPAGQPVPECTARVPVAELRVAKTVDHRRADPGATLTYTITVTNTGRVDYTGANRAKFTDDLSDVLDDANYNEDATASSGTVAYVAPVLSWSGDLPVGGSATVTYSVVVKNPDTGDRLLTNAVVGGTNCPPGSTDPACTVTVPSPHVAVRKVADLATAHPGDTVHYTVTVTNDGPVDFTAADPASFTDDLTGDLDDAAYGNDAAADGGTVSYAVPTLTWSGPLATGQTVTITYSMTVNDPDAGDHRLTNVVTAPVSNCAASSTDPACRTVTPVQDVVLRKVASADSAVPGDQITYTITVTNTGQVDYTDAHPATFTDDLTGDLDDATYSDDAAADTGTVSYAEPVLSWSGPLPVGATATITYSLQVKDPDNGDLTLLNAVVGPPYSNCRAGSTDPDCGTVTPVTPPVPPGGVTPPPGGVTPPRGGTGGPPLAFTGVSVVPFLWWSAAFLMLGVVLTGLARRRVRRLAGAEPEDSGE